MKIYISPHSDDVALSCGGRIIADPKGETLVLNIFTSEGDGSAHSRLFDQVNSERSREDLTAWDSIGVRCEFTNLPEALLRAEFPFRLLNGGSDPGLVASVCDVVHGYVDANPRATFFFPAGFGSHVDHLACRDAAFRLLDSARLNSITLYEDVPYSWLRFIRSQQYRELLRTVELDPDSRAAASRRDGVSLGRYLRGTSVPFPRGKKLFPLVHATLFSRNLLPRAGRGTRYRGVVRTMTLDHAQMARKEALIFEYASQLPMLFGDKPEQALRALRQSFAQEVTIEVTRR